MMDPLILRNKNFMKISEDIIQRITMGKIKQGFLYDPEMFAYNLFESKEKEKSVHSIDKVTGISEDGIIEFIPGSDFELLRIPEPNSIQWQLKWLDGQRPLERTEFLVEFTLDEKPIVTDSNVGSVLRTIVEAISREIEYLYLQMDKVYESGFIDTARGNSLDQVVSILGMEYRRPNESDNSLRERARGALSVLGKATEESIIGSLRSKFKEKLKTDPKILENEDVTGAITIIVDVGGELEEGLKKSIEEEVQQNKAAGIVFEIIPAKYLQLDLDMSVSITKGYVWKDLEEKIRKKTTNYFDRLGIGDEIKTNKISLQLLEIKGIDDVEKPELIQNGLKIGDYLRLNRDQRALLNDLRITKKGDIE